MIHTNKNQVGIFSYNKNLRAFEPLWSVPLYIFYTENKLIDKAHKKILY